MAKIYKRADSKYYWAYIPKPNGGYIRKSTGFCAIKDAKEWAAKIEADLWRQAKIANGEKVERTWKEAVVRWVSEKSDKASIRDDLAKLKWLDQHLGDKLLRDITRTLVLEISEAKAQESSKATANRYVALISAIMHRAEKVWEWTDKTPVYHKYKETDRRIRYLTPAQAKRLLDELPQHQRDVAAFALCTGLRQGNILGLEWSQIDLKRRVAWIHGDQAKAGKPIAVPLNDMAADIVVRQHGKNNMYVFTYQGEKISNINTRSWRNALKRAGIDDFRWHDLRHTFASWLAMSGASLIELQELGGWKKPEMVRRYAHLSANHLAAVSQNVCTFFAQAGGKNETNTSKSLNSMAPRPGLEPGTCGLTVRKIKAA